MILERTRGGEEERKMEITDILFFRTVANANAIQTAAAPVLTVSRLILERAIERDASDRPIR